MIDIEPENMSAAPGTSPENYFRFTAATADFVAMGCRGAEHYFRFGAAIFEIDGGP